MKSITTYDNDGRVTGSFTIPDVDVEAMTQGQNFVYGKAGIDNYVKDGIIKTYPDKPGDSYIFNFQTETWDLSIEDLKIEITTKRNALLAASDWTQLPDVPQATKDAWAQYRQALRDITEQLGYSTNVLWPTSP
jgi:hypothetical protein